MKCRQQNSIFSHAIAFDYKSETGRNRESERERGVEGESEKRTAQKKNEKQKFMPAAATMAIPHPARSSALPCLDLLFLFREFPNKFAAKGVNLLAKYITMRSCRELQLQPGCRQEQRLRLLAGNKVSTTSIVNQKATLLPPPVAINTTS